MFKTPHYFTGKVCLFQVLLEQSMLQLMGIGCFLVGMPTSPPPLSPSLKYNQFSFNLEALSDFKFCYVFLPNGY